MKLFRNLVIFGLIVCHQSFNVIASGQLQSIPSAIPSNYYEMEYDTYNEMGNTWQTVSMVTEEMKNRG